MKVITIKEPWASLIVNGYKEYEFRSWKTNYRGKVLIHAGLSSNELELKKFSHLNLKYAKGEIIGEAYLNDCIKVDDKFNKELLKKDSLVYQMGEYNRNYAFYLTGIKKYSKRIKCKGKLGLWNYEE